jgi:hypothetical protein
MDVLERRRRREEARRRTVRQRRLAGGALLLIVAAGVALFGFSLSDSTKNDSEAESEEPTPPPELPRGGRTILPDWRVVAYYGAPQTEELGALGVGTPEQAGRRLERQARRYRPAGRPVLPAFELISTIVHADAGDDGDYAERQKPRVIRRYLRAARRHRALLILDVQPGRAAFMDEVRALRPYLDEPDVSLALDPEWSMDPGELPGQSIGSTDAGTINAVGRYLSRIVRERDLPQKLLVIHRFTTDMIENERRLRRYPGVALTVNVDGFGDRPNKISKYREFTRGKHDRHHGFKLFYREDLNLMPPRLVMRLRPRPELVVYE